MSRQDLAVIAISQANPSTRCYLSTSFSLRRAWMGGFACGIIFMVTPQWGIGGKVTARSKSMRVASAHRTLRQAIALPRVDTRSKDYCLARIARWLIAV